MTSVTRGGRFNHSVRKQRVPTGRRAHHKVSAWCPCLSCKHNSTSSFNVICSTYRWYVSDNQTGKKQNMLMYLCISTLNPSICAFHFVYLCCFIKYAQVAHAHLDLVSGHILLPPFLDCIQLIQQECISGNRTSPTVAINNMAFEMWRMGSGTYKGWNHTTHSKFMALGQFKLL